jgi:hypothetical protein
MTLTLLSQIGRTPTLLGLGVFCIVITLANLINEKRSRSQIVTE